MDPVGHKNAYHNQVNYISHVRTRLGFLFQRGAIKDIQSGKLVRFNKINNIFVLLTKKENGFEGLTFNHLKSSY